jgi:hypothetical protein
VLLCICHRSWRPQRPSSVVRLARSSAEPEQRRQQAEAIISTGKTNGDKKNAPLVKKSSGLVNPSK